MSLKKISRAIQALNNKDIKQAAAIFDSVGGKLSQPQHLHACAVAYLQSGRSLDAQKVLSKLLAKVQPTPQLLSLSGDINKSNGDLNSSIVDYQRACKLSPSSPELYYNLALVLFENQELPKTREVLKKALQPSRDEPTAAAVRSVFLRKTVVFFNLILIPGIRKYTKKCKG